MTNSLSKTFYETINFDNLVKMAQVETHCLPRRKQTGDNRRQISFNKWGKMKNITISERYLAFNPAGAA
jgi:hypothetical protein